MKPKMRIEKWYSVTNYSVKMNKYENVASYLTSVAHVKDELAVVGEVIPDSPEGLYKELGCVCQMCCGKGETVGLELFV